MPATVQETDVAIVGSGPVGLFAVFECGMLGLDCHLIDTLEAVGGQCVALYAEKPIYDIPGIPKLMAGELIERLAAQAAPFAPVFHLGQQVVALEPDGRGWRLETSQGTRIEARAVMIAAGVGSDVTLALGGKLDMPTIKRAGEPIEVTGRVRAITGTRSGWER